MPVPEAIRGLAAAWAQWDTRQSVYTAAFTHARRGTRAHGVHRRRTGRSALTGTHAPETMERWPAPALAYTPDAVARSVPAAAGPPAVHPLTLQARRWRTALAIALSFSRSRVLQAR